MLNKQRSFSEIDFNEIAMLNIEISTDTVLDELSKASRGINIKLLNVVRP